MSFSVHETGSSTVDTDERRPSSRRIWHSATGARSSTTVRRPPRSPTGSSTSVYRSISKASRVERSELNSTVRALATQSLRRRTRSNVPPWPTAALRACPGTSACQPVARGGSSDRPGRWPFNRESPTTNAAKQTCDEGVPEQRRASTASRNPAPPPPAPARSAGHATHEESLGAPGFSKRVEDWDRTPRRPAWEAGRRRAGPGHPLSLFWLVARMTSSSPSR